MTEETNPNGSQGHWKRGLGLPGLGDTGLQAAEASDSTGSQPWPSGTPPAHIHALPMSSCPPKVGLGSQADGQKHWAPETHRLPTTFTLPSWPQSDTPELPLLRTLPLHRLAHSFSFHQGPLSLPCKTPQAPPSHSKSQCPLKSLSSLGACREGRGQTGPPPLPCHIGAKEPQSEMTIYQPPRLESQRQCFHPSPSKTTMRETRGQDEGAPQPLA